MIDQLPTLNACLNTLAAVLLCAGWLCIRRKAITAHKTFMLSAFLVSSVFLASYLTFHYLRGSTAFTGSGVWRITYFAILIPHSILAAANVPMVLITLWAALSGRLDRHRRIARWTLPIWLFVSVTGVIVYFSLYRLELILFASKH